MKVLLKGLTGIVLGCICLVCASSDIYAGTCIYVGKDVSAEGTTIIGASMEGGAGVCTVPVIIEKGTYKKGDVIECSNGYNYTLPEDGAKLTLERIMSYAGYGEWNCCATNEYGVSVVSSITANTNLAAVEADPFEACGVTEEKLALILASTSKNAKEAVDLLCSQIEEIGADSAEIVLIADQESAWLVENFTGHQYAAIKLPADKMGTFAEEPVITAADLKGADVITSADLLTLPVDKGFAVYDDNKELDLIKTYNFEGNYSDDAHHRGWVGHELFCAEEETEYDPKAAYDVFFAPEGKINITDVFDFFRYRYPEVEPGTDSAVLGGIDNQFVSNVNVIQIFPDVAAPMSSILWTTPSQAVASMFMPIPSIADSLPDALATDVEEDEYKEGILQFDCAKLASKIVARRNLYGNSVRLYLKGEEALHTSDFASLVREDWGSKFASSPAEVINAADELVVLAVKEEADICAQISDKFDWYLVRNGVVSPDVPDEELAPFELDSNMVTIGNAIDNGWNVSVDGDVVKAENDGKTIEFNASGNSEIKLSGFDTGEFIDDFFNGGNGNPGDDFVIELDDVQSDDGMEIVLDENGELAAEEAAAEDAASTNNAEAAAEEVAEEPAQETAEEPAEEPAKESAEEPAEEPAKEPAQDGTQEVKTDAKADTPEVDTIADLQNYFAEKIASVPRDGWAENEIAEQLTDVSNDVAAILTGYLVTYYDKYVGQLSGDISDVDKIMNFDPAQAANDIATDVANDEEIAKAGSDIAGIGVFVSGLLNNYLNALAEDVTGDMASGRLSQEGAVSILNEAAGDIEAVVGAYVGIASEKAAEAAQTVKDSVPPKEEVKETLTEIDDALDVLDEYGVIDKDAIGLGDAKLADLADLTDADINVVVTLDAMDEETLNGLSQLLGVDVRATIDKYMEQINAAGLGVNVNK